MSTRRQPQDADKYIVRFPDGMRDRIAEAAKGNSRTINGEIIARLERSFAGEAVAEDASPELIEQIALAHTPGTPESALSARLAELEAQAKHTALLMFLGEIEYAKLQKAREPAPADPPKRERVKLIRRTRPKAGEA